MSETLKIRGQEDLALELMRHVRADAERASAPQAVELVTVTLDLSGQEGQGATRFDAKVDRKTRTLIFTGGRAFQGSATIMTVSAVYRILSGD